MLEEDEDMHCSFFVYLLAFKDRLKYLLFSVAKKEYSQQKSSL